MEGQCFVNIPMSGTYQFAFFFSQEIFIKKDTSWENLVHILRRAQNKCIFFKIGSQKTYPTASKSRINYIYVTPCKNI